MLWRVAQSGNSQFYGSFFCDTGILVSDRAEAYVVNCAGRHWAARKVGDVMAISNRYQTADDWEDKRTWRGGGWNFRL